MINKKIFWGITLGILVFSQSLTSFAAENIQPVEENNLPIEESGMTVADCYLEKKENTLSVEETDSEEVDVLEAVNIAEGQGQGYTWVLEKNGKLTVRDDGTGTCNLSGNAWSEYKDRVQTVDIEVCYSSHLAGMFENYVNLTEVKMKIDRAAGSMSRMFGGCLQLAIADIGDINTAEITSMKEMFDGCINLKNLYISAFDTKNVVDMSGMFRDCKMLFTLNLSYWDTSKVTDMSEMFKGCVALATLNLSHIKTDNVVSMKEMFGQCTSLTSLDTTGFDTSKVTDMSGMFSGCEALEYLNVSTFNTFHVTNMDRIFLNCKSLTSLNIDSFDTTLLNSTEEMFKNCEKLTSLNISNLNTENVTNMRLMFSGCASLETIDVSHFNTSKVQDMNMMFSKCTNLKYMDLSSFDVRNVERMWRLFEYCTNLEKLDLHGWMIEKLGYFDLYWSCDKLTDLDVSGWKFGEGLDSVATYGIFSGLGGIQTVDVSTWDISNLTSMYGLFSGCGMTSIDLSAWDFSKVKNMHAMFANCKNLTTVDVKDWDVSNVEDMSSMFSGDVSLTHLEIDNWDTSKVRDISNMFQGCKLLQEMDLSSLDLSNVRDICYLFHGCTGLKYVNMDGVDLGSMIAMESMFDGCSSLEKIGFSNIHTTNITCPGATFRGCSSLKYLDLSGFVFASKTYGYIDRYEGSAIFRDCDSLVKIKTPKNVGDNFPLPKNKVWLDGNSGEQYYSLPKGLSYSVTLRTNQSIFADVEKESWKYSFVKYVYDKGIMTGKGFDDFGDAIFDPDASLTRAELAQMLYSLEGKPAVIYTDYFTDVPENVWYTKAVLWANAQGIATGVADNTFDPMGKITREQVATMLKKYAESKFTNLTATTELNGFIDADAVSPWAKGNVSWAVANGIISGKALDDGSLKLDPKGNATRAECAAMIKSFCVKMENLTLH